MREHCEEKNELKGAALFLKSGNIMEVYEVLFEYLRAFLL